MKLSKIFIALALMLSAKAHAQKGTISVSVGNFKNNNGICWVCLYKTANGFPKDTSKAVKNQKVTIIENKVHVDFLNLPAGEYAVATYHDENADGKLNENFMGKPKEGTGVSKNAFHNFSAPGFDDNKFMLENNGRVNIEMKLRY